MIPLTETISNTVPSSTPSLHSTSTPDVKDIFHHSSIDLLSTSTSTKRRHSSSSSSSHSPDLTTDDHKRAKTTTQRRPQQQRVYPQPNWSQHKHNVQHGDGQQQQQEDEWRNIHVVSIIATYIAFVNILVKISNFCSYRMAAFDTLLVVLFINIKWEVL